MENNLLKEIVEKINKGGEISPFLFIGEPIELINKEIENLSLELANKYFIDKNFIFKFEDNGEKIKIKDIKAFLEKSFFVPEFGYQIFIIEEIARMTEESANSCLKIFEEPSIGNIFFLTSTSESSILETILSRCTLINLKNNNNFIKNDYYFKIIDDYIKGLNHDFASYIFKEKLEKQDYIEIAKNMINYFKKNGVFLDLIEQLNDDINGIIKNNLLPKYIIDKYITKIKKS